MEKDSNIYECELCDFRENSIKRFYKHSLSVHGIARFQCEQCSYQTNWRFYMRDHKLAHENIKYKCDLCDFKERNSDRFYKHKLIAHGIARYQCDQCNYQTNENSHFKNHVSTHERFKYECDLCDFKEKCGTRFYKHRISVHGIGLFQCDQCHYQTNSDYDLKKHKKLGAHTIKIKKLMKDRYQCDQCSFQTYTLSTLHNHVANIHQKLKSQCKYCNFRFSERLLSRHEKHCSENPKLAVCKCCGSRFHSETMLAHHFKTRHVQNSCKFCDYRALNKGDLSDHISRNHEASLKTPLNCQKCDITFTRDIELKRHIYIVHNKQEIFECNLCEKIFARKFYLTRHVSTAHIKSKKPCDYVTRSSSLVHEFDGHSGKRQCPSHCGVKFRNEKLLKDHLAKKHSIIYSCTKFNGYVICTKCDYACKSSKQFQTHVNLRHKKEKECEIRLFCCLRCSFSTESKCNLLKHNKENVGRLVHKLICYKCDKEFEKEILWKKHVRKKTCTYLQKQTKIIRKKISSKEGDSKVTSEPNKSASKRRKLIIEKISSNEEDSKVTSELNESASKQRKLIIKKISSNEEDSNVTSEPNESASKQVKKMKISSKEGDSKEAIQTEMTEKRRELSDTSSVTEKDNVYKTDIKEEPNDEAHHSQKLAKLCRLCGSSTDDEFLVSDMFAEILILTGIDTFKDLPYVHPQKICEICNEKLKHCETFSVVDFKPHSENCTICVPH